MADEEETTDLKDLLMKSPPLVVSQRGYVEVTRLTPEASVRIQEEIEKQLQSQVTALSSKLKMHYLSTMELISAILCICATVVSSLASLYFFSIGENTTSSLLIWPAAAGVGGTAILLYAMTRSDLVDEE